MSKSTISTFQLFQAIYCGNGRVNTMTLNELQENLKRKGYTSEEIDIEPSVVTETLQDINAGKQVIGI